MLLELPHRRRALVALTPIIDVVFILLLFFMLTTRFGQPQMMSLRMSGEGVVQPGSTLARAVLRLNADDTVELPDGRRIAGRALGRDPLLADLLAGSTPLRLEVVDEADLQGLVGLLDRLQAIGFRDVAVRGPGR